MCKCTDINIHLFKNGDYHFDFNYNYKTKKPEGSKYSWVIQKLNNKYEQINDRFNLRNTKVRLLYSKKLLNKTMLEIDKVNTNINIKI